MNPPTFATWLMGRFGVHESAIGDLIERYRAEPSLSWYWRQTLVALLSASWSDVSAFKLASAIAVSVGWGAVLAVFGLSSLLAPDGQKLWSVWLNVGPPSVVIWTHWWEPLLDLRVALLGCAGFALAGCLVARLRRSALFVLIATVGAWGLSSSAVVLFGPAWHGFYWHAPYSETMFVIQASAYLILATVVLPCLVLVGFLGASSQPGSRKAA
jgi:hypothetical protein